MVRVGGGKFRAAIELPVSPRKEGFADFATGPECFGGWRAGWKGLSGAGVGWQHQEILIQGSDFVQSSRKI